METLGRRGEEAIGAHAASRLSAFIAQTTAQARRRLPRLRQIGGIEVLDDPAGAEGTWPFHLLLLPSQQQRDAALAELWQAGMGVSRLYIDAMPDYAYLKGMVPAQDVPNARDFAARTLSISNSPWVDDGDFETVCRILEKIVA
ncbi:MAG: hypothetical protein WDW38_009631 [Sanguina aurantia]